MSSGQAADEKKVTRFFKLFPLIGRTDVGPETYGYVRQGVSVRARDTCAERRTAADGDGGLGDIFCANAVVRLFEHIAK